MNPQRKVWLQRLSVWEGRLELRWLWHLSSDESLSKAIGIRCDVTSWEDQVNFFQAAFDAFGSVDVVVRRVFHAISIHSDAFFAGCQRWGD
jgi:hypothetical protein